MIEIMKQMLNIIEGLNNDMKKMTDLHGLTNARIGKLEEDIELLLHPSK